MYSLLNTLPEYTYFLYQKTLVHALFCLFLKSSKAFSVSSSISTHSKYSNYTMQWLSYSKNMHRIEVTHILDYLSAMFDKGCVYSTINSAKSAIANIDNIPPYSSINKHPLIKKYMTGIFNLNPPKPKLSSVWDGDILFRYFE